MKVMITGSKDPLSVAPFWYKERIGEVFEVTEDPNYSEYYLTANPIYKGHQGHILKIDCILVLDVSPQAIKTTEIPSKAVAVEGILTEEELKERNRLLVLENDELNAENMEYRTGLFKAYDFIFTELAIPKRFREMYYRILLIDCKLDPNMRWRNQNDNQTTDAGASKQAT